MARKKRQIPEQFKMPVQEDKKKVVYEDNIQSNVNRRVEDYGRKFEGKGKNILYALAALAVLATLFGIFYAWNRRSDAEAQTALGKAIETMTLPVKTQPTPANYAGKVYNNERERTESAVNEFQAVADKFGSPVREKARYFAAVNRLKLDRAAALPEIEELSQMNGEVGTLSKFALAQAKFDDGKLDEAAALYESLAALEDPILAKETISLALGKVYEKQSKKAEAADQFYNVAKTASEAKDLEDKPIPMSATATEALEKLKQLDPEKAKEINVPETPSPAGLSPGGM